MKVKAKHSGDRKPHVELKIGPSHSHALSKPVDHTRLIDRGNDFYRETVTDYESGEVIHQTVEPLSEHVGHGSAKSNKSEAEPLAQA